MALPAYFTTSATLAGAISLVRMFRPWAQQDGAAKMQFLISQVNALISNTRDIQSALSAANASAITFSSLSGVAFVTYSTISNFSST